MFKSLLAGAALALLASAAAPLAFGGEAEFVYVESNIKSPNGNSIYAFRRGEHGSLTLVPGAPFLTGGAGVQDASLKLGPYDSDTEIITNPEHTLLFAVNSGSDSIAVFEIQENGALKPIEGSPFPSGGTNPVSLALSGNTLFVVNKNGDFARQSGILPNYTSFRVLRDGRLRPLEGSTVSVALGSSPTQALFVPGTNLLFGADFLGGLLQRFNVNNDGYLRPRTPDALPGSEFADDATPRLPLGLWFHPIYPLLYVGFVTENRLGVYEYNSYGHLKFLRSVPNSGKAICWLRVNRAGTRLYSSDTGTNSISVYDLGLPEEPREIETVALSGLGNVLQFSLSSDNKYLYALSSRGSAEIPDGEGNILHVLAVASDGSVTEATGDAFNFHLPNGVRPQGVTTVTVR